MVTNAPAARPLQREIRVLVRALIVFLFTLIVALLALVLTLVRSNRFVAMADNVRDAVAPIAASASSADLQARLDILHRENGISRIEVYRDQRLFVSAGEVVSSAEVITRELPRGKILFYFDVSTGNQRTAVIVGALATLAAMMGLLILILYLPKFVRPLEQMLEQAAQLGHRPRGDHDARYLVDTFREAVETLQQQGRELDHLRDAASSRQPDIRELANAIHRSFNSGFIALDANGRVVAVNDPGRSMLRLGDAVDSVDALPPPLAELVGDALRTRTPLTRREVRIDAADTLIGITTVPLFEGEQFLGVFALFTDLTASRAMEHRLRDFESLVGLGQMSAGIAHEFRNSLSAILGYLRLAQKSADEPAAAKIRSAEDEAKRLAAAVDALLNFARPLTVSARSLRLDEVVRRVVARLAAEAPDVAMNVSAPEAVEVNGDPELLERALDNIVRNAVDAVRQRHAEGGGRIGAGVVTDGALARVTIRDNGVGIDPADAARLMLPFQSSKSHGFGLGLALAKKIALHHGGTLSLSGKPGAGAVVTLELPRQM
ncbi:MAG TPA: ATP-binding protein [Thermoanaerobaculia bacterium]|nr:ATP-binding protein [Thermoanaerobaculia bacterium]